MKPADTDIARPRILVADDDRVILLTLVEGLREAGFEVMSAQDGPSALALCLESRPDFALLDIRMPGLTGLELARRLAAGATVPFMFLTAYDDQQLIDEAVKAGAFGYLVKPIDVARIVPTLQAALARAAELRRSREAEQSLAAALVSNREIATAVGMLMQRHDVTAEAAFEAIRRHARRQQRKVVEVANAITRGENGIDVGGAGNDDGTPRAATANR
jgi:response regulator NasT